MPLIVAPAVGSVTRDLRRRRVGRRRRDRRARQDLDRGQVPLVGWSAPCRRSHDGPGGRSWCGLRLRPEGVADAGVDPLVAHRSARRPRVRAVAPSQSLPTPNTHAAGGGRGQRRARRARSRRRPRSTRRRRAAPAKAITVSDWSIARPRRRRGDGRRPPPRPGAVAFQISDVPGRVFARRTSDQVSPPPVTVDRLRRCRAVGGRRRPAAGRRVCEAPRAPASVTRAAAVGAHGRVDRRAGPARAAASRWRR